MIPKLTPSLRSIAFVALCAIASTPQATANSTAAPINRTGAPPQGPSQSCSVCHGGPGGGSVGLEFSGDAAYTPGEMYTLMVTVDDPGKKRFGFSMVARDTDNNTVDVGSWTATGPNTGVNGSHVGHVNAPRVDDRFTFTVTWTAPETGVGDVTFYIAGNGANGAGTSGDNIYLETVTISEASTPPTPPTLAAFSREADGTVMFTLTGGAGETYTIEHSENLENWFLLEERTLGSPSEQVTDSGAIGKARRFYRARPGAAP